MSENPLYKPLTPNEIFLCNQPLDGLICSFYLELPININKYYGNLIHRYVRDYEIGGSLKIKYIDTNYESSPNSTLFIAYKKASEKAKKYMAFL